MNKVGLSLLFGTAFLLSTVGVRAESVAPARFMWLQPIIGSMEAGQLYRVRIPGPLFGGCRDFPVDLRIIDEQGNLWPHFVWIPRERTLCRQCSHRQPGSEVWGIRLSAPPDTRVSKREKGA